jgi:hypothetical protein
VNDKKITLILLGIVSFVCLLFIAVGFILFSKGNELKERANYEITAQIVDTKIEDKWHKRDKSYYVERYEYAEVEYEYNDKTYTEWLSYGREPGYYSRRDRIEIKINPDNPTEIYTEDDVVFPIILMAVGFIAGTILSIGLIKIYLDINKNEG